MYHGPWKVMPHLPFEKSVSGSCSPSGATLYLLIRSTANWSVSAAAVHDAVLSLTLEMDPTIPVDWTQLAPFEELATLSGAALRPLSMQTPDAGVRIDVPIADLQRSILVIDDNEDILELFQRYLSGHHYGVRVAKTA